MGKKLTVSAVNSNAKKTFAMKKVQLTDNQGEVWEVEVDEKMNPTKVELMLKDTIILISKILEEGFDKEFNIEENWLLLYYIEILKKYTSLEIKELATAEETVKSYIALISNLSALGLDEELLDSFDEKAREEIAELYLQGITEMSNVVLQATQEFVSQKVEEQNG